jgi:hypothetical protein
MTTLPIEPVTQAIRDSLLTFWSAGASAARLNKEAPAKVFDIEAERLFRLFTTPAPSQRSELADWAPFNYERDNPPKNINGGWEVTWASGLVETISSFDNVNYAHLVKYRPALRQPPSDAMRQQGQAEGFAAAVQQLRDYSAQKPKHRLAQEAQQLADSLEQSRIPCAALTQGKPDHD